MGTDSTELTFIRCPSCRSLVPAASPRCRMCGATLEAGKKSSSESPAPKGNVQRARQQTVEVAAEEEPADLSAEKEVPVSGRFKHTKKFARDVVARQGSNDKPKTAAVVEKSSIAADGSDEYISEDEIRGEDTDPGDPLGAFLEEVAVESEERSLNDSDSEEQTGNGLHTEEEDFGMEDFTEEVVVPADEVEEPVPEEQEFADVASPVPPKVAKESAAKSQQPSRTESYFRKSKQAVVREKSKAPPAESVYEFEAPAMAAKSPAEVEHDSHSQKSRVAPAEQKPAYHEGVKGRLMGWLVSYADPRGTAIELREGKFFVSRSSLKGSDLILDDESISTPHALFGITAAEGIKIQDLMSDRGVFIRRQGTEAYQRMLESAALEHGDWVRFGDVEFQVAVL